MRAVILQSAYMPWLGYFDLIAKSDVFIFLDDVQWRKRDWRNRNRIRTQNGWKWFTVPAKMEHDHSLEHSIHEIEIDNSRSWWVDHLNLFHNSYKRAPCFEEVFHDISSILSVRHKRICDLNYEILKHLCLYLGIDYHFLYSQEMDIDPELRKEDRLLAILDIVKADTYLSGPGARNYLDKEKFNSRGITVEWHDYRHPYYSQELYRTDTFISYLSVLDLLFHHGRESRDILLCKKVIERPNGIRIKGAYE